MLDTVAAAQFDALERNCRETGIMLFNMQNPNQGIVHVIGPELGITQPGQTIVCGDSHTATHGAFGALAFGIGTSEIEHVLATQCLSQFKSKTMLVRVSGTLAPGVTAKDIILAVIGKMGIAGGTGHAIEYAGDTIRALSMEGRMTVCNMTIEGGARTGMVAPDDTTFAYLEGRPFVPRGQDFQVAVDYWKSLATDPGAAFDDVLELDAASIAPQVTWGTNPGMVTDVTGKVPDPGSFRDPVDRKAAERALEYMGLEPGTRIVDIPLDYVFIGSCTNSRIEDLRLAARVAAGRKVSKTLKSALGSSRLHAHEGPGGEGRPGQDIPRSRIRVARRGLQHVPGNESRCPPERPAQRQHFEPELRRTPGQGRPHSSGQPRDGRRRRHRRPLCGYSDLECGTDRNRC